MKNTNRVHTRKIALLRELGYDEYKVADDGSFGEDGFSVIDESTSSHLGVVLRKISWPNAEIAERALAARDADYLESIGRSEVEEREAMIRTLGIIALTDPRVSQSETNTPTD